MNDHNLNVLLAAVGVVTLIGTLAGAYLALFMRGIDKDNKALSDRQDAEHDERKKLEDRLATVERSYISRAEHAEFRAELMTAVRDIGERVEKSINGLGSRVEQIVDRLAKVEAA